MTFLRLPSFLLLVATRIDLVEWSPAAVDIRFFLLDNSNEILLSQGVT